jgi:hypothetical protein
MAHSKIGTRSGCFAGRTTGNALNPTRSTRRESYSREQHSQKSSDNSVPIVEYAVVLALICHRDRFAALNISSAVVWCIRKVSCVIN